MISPMIKSFCQRLGIGSQAGLSTSERWSLESAIVAEAMKEAGWTIDPAQTYMRKETVWLFIGETGTD